MSPDPVSHPKQRAIVRLLPVLLVLAAAPAVFAASAPIVFAGLEQVPFGKFTGSSNANSVAADVAGNIYVSEPSHNWVTKVTPDGTTTTITFSPVLHSPRGLVVDASNNLWIANNGANTVTKHPLRGGADTTIHGFHSPYGLAIDAAGSLYVSNSATNTVQVLAAGATVPTDLVTSGISQARGLAVDNNGHLFIADMSANAHSVLEVATTGGAVLANVSVAPCQPRDLATNLSGDLFIGCNNLSPTIYRIPNEGGILNPADKTSVSSAGLTGGGGIHGLGFVNGSLFATNGGSIVDKIQIDSVDVGSFLIGSTAATLATSVKLNFSALQTTNLGLIAAYSDGASETNPGGPADYQTSLTPVPANRCAIAGGTFGAGTSCEITINYLPNAIGVRRGAVIFFDASSPNKPVFTLPLTGIGLGSRIAYGLAPIQNSNLLTNGIPFNGPVATLIDGLSNRYVSDALNNRVVEFTPISDTGTTVGTGLTTPFGLALDGAGNLYIADSVLGIVKVPNENGVLNSADQSIVTTDVYLPAGLRLDKQQNLYVADAFNNRVLKIPNEDGVLNPAHQQVIGSGFTSPSGVFPDPAGNVWVADTGFDTGQSNFGRIVKVAPDGTQTTIPIDPENGVAMDAPLDVVLDSAGDLYISDANNARVLYVSADQSIQALIYQKPNKVPSDVYSGLWIDPLGQLYITDFNGGLTLISDLAYPLNFPNTVPGSTSAPLTIQTSNVGNVPLNLKGITFPSRFHQQPVGGSPIPDCAAFQLAPGKSCLLGIVFSPSKVGAVTGNLRVRSTDFNAGPPSYSTDLFPLSGTGAAAASTSPTSQTGK